MQGAALALPGGHFLGFPVRGLQALLGAPRLHHWHHALDGGGRVNFANLSPLMDVLFGTWHDPGTWPERVGIREPFARSYAGAMLEPLLPRRAR